MMSEIRHCTHRRQKKSPRQSSGAIRFRSLPDFSRSAASAAFRAHLILARQLLGATAELLLQRDVARPLHWSHEAGEVLLLFLDQRYPLLLELQRSVEKRADVLLIRLGCGCHLQPQLAPRLP